MDNQTEIKIETTPCNTDGGNMDKDDIPFDILVGGKPLLNTDGTVFFTTHNYIKKFYEAGNRLIVGTLNDENEK